MLGTNTLYINFCLFKQMPMAAKQNASQVDV